MSCPSSSTPPPTRVPGTVSCIRFRQRSIVDFAQPDGPIIAVTSWAWKSTVTPRTTWVVPKKASRSRTATRVSPASWPADGLAAALAVTRTRRRSVCAKAVAGAGGVASDDADDEDDPDEYEGAGPGKSAPLVVGRGGIVEDA